MYEVELKVPADHERVRMALAEAGATPVDHVSQIDTYYDAPHREFADTDEALRLREETELDDGKTRAKRETRAQSETRAKRETRTKMTYKGPLVEAESKTREEHETVVDDGDAAAGILDGLGFEPAATVEKERERFELEGYTLTLDSVEGVGSFVEVEQAAAEPEVERVRTGAQSLLRDLGLDPADQVRTSYLGLLLAEDAQE